MKLGFVIKRKFRVFSLSGSRCYLNCLHCKGYFLKGMYDLSPYRDPEKLVRLFNDLFKTGMRGALISGGFTKRGTLINIEYFLPLLADIKKKLNMVFTCHLGFEYRRDILFLAKEVFDVIDYEFTLDPYIASRIRPFTTSMYFKTLQTLLSYDLRLVPHVYLWHPEKDSSILIDELKMINDLGLDRVTLLVYMDPIVTDLCRDLNYRRKLINKLKQYLDIVEKVFEGEKYLGCMRPQVLKQDLDFLASTYRSILRIANPHPSIRSTINAFYDCCCSIPREYLEIFKLELDLYSYKPLR